MAEIQPQSEIVVSKRKLPRPVQVLKAVPYAITAIWNTGEIRINYFDIVAERWSESSALAPLINPDVFAQVQVIDRAFAWEEPKIIVDGKQYNRDLDPNRCFKESKLIQPFQPEIQTAQFLKNLRLKAGLTQSQLGERTGYSSKYISKIERGVTDIQIGTLQYILEVGLGRNLRLIDESFNLAA